MGNGTLAVVYGGALQSGLREVWLGNRAAIASDEDIDEGTKLGEIIIEPALRFGPTCAFTELGQIKVQTKVLYDLVAVSVDEAGRQRGKGGEVARAHLATGPGAPLACPFSLAVLLLRSLPAH